MAHQIDVETKSNKTKTHSCVNPALIKGISKGFVSRAKKLRSAKYMIDWLHPKALAKLPNIHERKIRELLEINNLETKVEYGKTISVE